MSTARLKKEFLKLLEEDEEFRLAVAGLIGLRDILEELKKLREDFNKKCDEFDKRFLAIEEELKRLREDFNKLYQKSLEHDKRFEEMNRRFEAIEHKLLEHDKRFEVIEEELKKHREILVQHYEALRKLLERSEKHESAIGALGETLGLLMEFVLSEKVLEIIEESARREGDEVLSVKRRHVVDGVYEVDLYIETRKRIYLVEVKSRPSVTDVEKLARLRDFLIQQQLGKEVIAMLTAFKAKTPYGVTEKALEVKVDLMLF